MLKFGLIAVFSQAVQKQESELQSMKFQSFLFDNALRCALLCLVAGTSLSADELLAQDRTTPLKVMSFNIRYGKANDGANRWDKRDSLVAETIRVFGPDLLGLQEALPFQCEFLKQQFPEFDFVGRGREVKPNQGEFCAIIYRRERFEKKDEGHFWLSETPQTPGSRSWDSSLPRMVTWVRLWDRATESEFIFANTHYDHIGQQARIASSQIIRKWMAEFPETPFVITGDFNSAIGSKPYQKLLDGGSPELALVDTYRATYPQVSDLEGTSSRWSGNRKGARIDWILHSKQFNTLNAAIDYHNDQGQYPSDHYPVQATLRLIR